MPAQYRIAAGRSGVSAPPDRNPRRSNGVSGPYHREIPGLAVKASINIEIDLCIRLIDFVEQFGRDSFNVHLRRIGLRPAFRSGIEVSNSWFCTNPTSPFVSGLIVAVPASLVSAEPPSDSLRVKAVLRLCMHGVTEA